MTDLQARYDAAPKVTQSQVAALLGMGNAPREHDGAGKPWSPVVSVSDELTSNAKGMAE